jgi:hypothetical protein
MISMFITNLRGEETFEMPKKTIPARYRDYYGGVYAGRSFNPLNLMDFCWQF